MVIPYYKASGTLLRALESVAAQQQLPAEVIIVDDCSGALEAERLDQIARSFTVVPVRVLHLAENGGPAVARNTGWDAAREKYVAFLDADDSWHQRKLEIQATAMERDPGLTMLATGVNALGDQEPGQSPPVIAVSARQQLLRNRFVTSSVMIRTGTTDRFRSELRYSEDNELWCRLLLTGHRCGRVASPLTNYHNSMTSRSGASGNFHAMFLGQLRAFSGLRKQRLLTIGQAAMAFGSASVRYARRRTMIAADDLKRLVRRGCSAA
ncbi:glycosyltransferase family 2 protein [Parenemella sanctibonifatiensis]|uniref:glycosyltransferase family 2 protein n=1 Tax=Parenemella sanctibonifatiensis TaxID=2016505 RepID=UPI002B4BF62C|nr:glycosyltransferase family 2 protein [Parenemella sanctibonifatiensis]